MRSLIWRLIAKEGVVTIVVVDEFDGFVVCGVKRVCHSVVAA